MLLVMFLGLMSYSHKARDSSKIKKHCLFESVLKFYVWMCFSMITLQYLKATYKQGILSNLSPY